ncbi:MAG: GatB/YqeY domain-containing protein [Candidatus Eisenbacteria bacterium]|nr:GatB/YqeY domain-containing protein [Candidatus Eisenbacteria bacterium]
MIDASILARLQTDMVIAMKARDADTLSTLRMLKSALMEAKTRMPRDVSLSPEEEIEVLQRYVKKRRESIEEFGKHGLGDRVAREHQEIEVTQRYLPEAISEDAILAIVRQAIAATGAAGPKDMGKVIGAVMPKVKGRAEGSTVSKMVRQALGG